MTPAKQLRRVGNWLPTFVTMFAWAGYLPTLRYGAAA